eukprot:m.141698 g.141698  ORF g.141698 m.141698 type:complete len:51 (-) comp14858_c0_seq4:2386-2538(-)
MQIELLSEAIHTMKCISFLLNEVKPTLAVNFEKNKIMAISLTATQFKHVA